jgi:hypothetical protein
MKKLFLIVLLFSTIICFAQQKKEAKNEVTISPVSIFFVKPTITYERLFKDGVHSVGIDLGMHFGENTDKNRINIMDHDIFEKNIIRPFYRLYFGENYNKIYFESHLSFDKLYYHNPYHYNFYDDPIRLDSAFNKIGLGFNIGYKKVSAKNFVFQLKTGVSKDFKNKYSSGFHSVNLSYRFTALLSIGKRF